MVSVPGLQSLHIRIFPWDGTRAGEVKDATIYRLSVCLRYNGCKSTSLLLNSSWIADFWNSNL